MRPTKQLYFSQLASVVALRSTCVRRSVGCILVNDKGHILGTGYNGVAAGSPHCNEGNPCEGCYLPPGHDKCEAVHAEVNAVLQCPNVWDIDTVYVTVSPCARCTKMLLNTGAKRIVYLTVHNGETGELLWRKAGREWYHYSAYTEDLCNSIKD